MTIADLLQRLVALFDSLGVGLLFEGDLTLLLKVLLANFFLSGFECGDISVVTLLFLFVNALKNRVLGNGFNSGFLGDTDLSILASGSLAEVDASRDGTTVRATSTARGATTNSAEASLTAVYIGGTPVTRG